MKLTGFADFDWESSGYSGNLPPSWLPVVSVNPTVLPRPGTYATLGIGVVGEMTIPVEFLYRGTLGFEPAMLNLFKRLNPVDTTPRQLRGVRNDGTPVQIPAVLQISQIVRREDLNSVQVNFVAVQPYWEPLNVATSATQVFESDGLRQSLLLDVLGEFPSSPTIRLMATAARASTTASVGWRYRERFTVQNAGTDPIQNYPYAIDIGLTAGIVSAGKARSDGNDLRVVFQGREIARNLVDWNGATLNTLVWIVIPYLAAGATLTYDVLYGNANAGTPPTLTAGADAPAFDIGTAGAGRSSNAKWVYRVDRTVANAGKGGWYLSQGASLPTVKFNVPGAWQLATTLVGNDDRSQQSFSTYTASGTKYQGRFEARRAKAGSIVVTEHNGADGVSLRNPIGMSSVRADIRWINMAKGDTDATPIGNVVIVGRNNAGEPWTVIYQNAALQDPEATIAIATYTPLAAVKELAFAVWPQAPVDKVLTVDPKARNDRYINAAWYTTLEVTIQSGVLVQTPDPQDLWTPAALGSAVRAWFRADSLAVANGAAIAQWDDSSANLVHATQATGASQPIMRTNRLNALPGVEFDGTDDYLITALTGSSQDETILAVIDLDTAPAGGRVILGPTASGGRTFRVNSSRQLEWLKSFVASIDVSAALVTIDTDTIVGGTLGATTGDENINGTIETFTHAQTLTASLTTRIGIEVDGSGSWDGDIHEIVVCSTLSAGNRQLVEGYLAWKWGLTAGLPGGHPYKSSQPILTAGTAPTEVEIYEFATKLRYGDGGATTGVPPYKAIKAGNADGGSGVGTPRLVAPLNKQIQVFTDLRKVEQWNVGLTAKEEDIPIAAVQAFDGVLDTSGATIEQQSADWMPLLPVISPLTNPDFDANILGWTQTNKSGLITVTRFRSAAVYVGATPGSLANTISASTLGSGLRAFTETADDRLPIGNRQNVSVGAELYTDNVNLHPRLTITFYDASLALLSVVVSADWTPPASSFRRRLFAAAVPAGAVYWAPGFEVWTAATNANGSVIADVVAVNDTEIAVIDTNTSGLTVGASWLNRYAY